MNTAMNSSTNKFRRKKKNGKRKRKRKNLSAMYLEIKITYSLIEAKFIITNNKE